MSASSGVIASLGGVHKDVLYYCEKNKLSPPPTFAATINTILQLLHQYPSGISRCIILTEVEARHKLGLRRGETCSRLKQTIAIHQIALDDIIEGELTRIADYKCKLSAEGAAVEILLHRKFSDIIAFIKFVLGFDLLQNRRVLLTNCRYRKSQSLVLMPTMFMMLVFDVNEPDKNSTLLRNLWYKMHDDMCEVVKTIPAATSPEAADQYNLTCKVFIVEIMKISDVFEHPEKQNMTYRVVQLSIRDKLSPSVGSDNLVPHDLLIYLILTDEQVVLSTLWKEHDTILLYRPYIASNSEQVLFGSSILIHGSMQCNKVTRPAPGFEDVSSTPNVLSIHLYYSLLTVAIRLNNIPKAAYQLSPIKENNSAYDKWSVDLLHELGLAKYVEISNKLQRVDVSKYVPFLSPMKLCKGMYNVTLILRVLHTQIHTHTEHTIDTTENISSINTSVTTDLWAECIDIKDPVRMIIVLLRTTYPVPRCIASGELVVANKLLINSNTFNKSEIQGNLAKLPGAIVNSLDRACTSWIDCVTEESSKLNNHELFINITRLSSLVSSHSFYQNCQLSDLVSNTGSESFRQVSACAKVAATALSTANVVLEKMGNDVKKPKLDVVKSDEETDFLATLVLDDGFGVTIIGIVTKTTVNTSADCHINHESHTVWIKCGVQYSFILSKILFPFESPVKTYVNQLYPGNDHIYRIHTMS